MKSVGPRDRVEGGLLGLAVGDALGVPVEFGSRADRSADPVVGMRGGGTWGQEPGTWSDDASLALCLAESIVRKGFDADDFAHRALRWLDEGYWTARGLTFDVGGATRRALDRVRAGMPAVLAGGRGENDNGNGALMRALPASAWLAASPEPLRFRAVAAYASTTHGHPRSVLAAWLHCLVAGRLLAGLAPAKAYEAAMAEARKHIASMPLPFRYEAGAYARVLDGGLAEHPATGIRGSGYVVHCLEAAFWCLLTTKDFRSCVLAAVNLGEDADTTAAVAGGLAGLAYGAAAIPAEWLAVLAREGEIRELGSALARLAAREKPFRGSYWVLPGSLLAGEYPRSRDEADSRAKIAALLGAGVSGLVDLVEDGEILGNVPVAPYAELLGAEAAARKAEVERRREPIRDRAASAEAAARALRDIDEMLAAGRTVYVHCLGGIGRTGTVIGAWLAERGLAPGAEAVTLVGALREASDAPDLPSPETEEQRRLVVSWRPGPRALIL